MYAGFYQLDDADYESYSFTGSGYFDAFWPFDNNYRYWNFVFNTANVYPSGALNTGVGYDGDYFGLNYGLEISYSSTSPASQFSVPTTTDGTIPALLDTNQTRWIFSYADDPTIFTEGSQMPIGVTFTNEPGLLYQMASNAKNYWGLPFLSTELAWGTNNNTVLQTATLNAGNGLSAPLATLYSETAQPQFQTVEYDFWNPDWGDAIPGMTNFSTTNQSHLMVVGVGVPNFNIAGYAKLAVQNGYSGVYGYLGQYFDNAYVITNGTVTTNTTGVLSSYGHFFATQPGPAALVTMPDPDTGERGTDTVYAIKLQFDVNHDGVMDTSFNGADNTSQEVPYNFWMNDNYDRYKYDADDNTNYQDDVGPAEVAQLPADQQVPDYQYTTNGLPAIPGTRDLEDYARLWIPGLAAAMKAVPTNYTVQLSIGYGDAQIRIFKAVEPDGGTNYLSDETTASNQVANSTALYVGLLGPSSPVVLGAGTNVSEHYIFCGAHTGNVLIYVDILDSNQNSIGSAMAFLQINDIKQMYERWTVGESPSVAPMTNATWQVDTNAFQYTPPTDTNTPYILFVHGWNMETWEKDRYAETAFKRLYWQGYQGRFGSFRWPTDYGFTGTSINAIIQAHNYDNSEYNAWQSAAGLLNKLTDLNAEYPSHVYMLVHSMGNIVAGEALRLAVQNGDGQLVNTYVASQAALPAHDYDASVTTPYLLAFIYNNPLVPDIFEPSGFNYGPSTPNIYGNRLSTNSMAVGRRISFYNTNDFALAQPRWGYDQITKPDVFVSEGSYAYDGSITDPAPWNHFEFLEEPDGTINFDIVGSLNNLYTVMSYAAEPRSTALGATSGITNFVNLNLTTMWPTDTSGHSYGDHFWHSAEFRGDAWQEWNYWQTLLRSSTLGFNINN